MNKLKLSRLCAAVDAYYKKAQPFVVTKELLMTMLNAYTKELPAKKQQFGDNDAKKNAYDKSLQTMEAALVSAGKDDWNAVTNALSFSRYIQNKADIQDKTFEEYLTKLMGYVEEFRKQPAKPAETPAATTTPAPAGAAPTAAKPTATKPAQQVMNYEGPIDPRIQQILVSNYKKDLGKSGPNRDGVDGKLGKLTRQALNEIRNGTDETRGMSDKVFFAHLLETQAPKPPTSSPSTVGIPSGSRVRNPRA